MEPEFDDCFPLDFDTQKVYTYGPNRNNARHTVGQYAVEQQDTGRLSLRRYHNYTMAPQITLRGFFFLPLTFLIPNQVYGRLTAIAMNLYKSQERLCPVSMKSM